MKVNQEFTSSFVAARRLVCSGLMCIASALCAAPKQPASSGTEIKFTAPREGTVLVNIYKSDGTLARRLVQGEHVAKGVQQRIWDGLLDDGTMAPPGDYTWKGLFHEGIGLKLRGWAGSGGGLPWVTPEGKGGWGGDRGVPSAVAADEKRVYLGWSLAENGRSVVACDPEGRVQWSHRRSEGPSGCKALAVDDGLVYVLGGLEGAGANGGAIYRLDVKDGTPVPWPNGAVDLKIFAFWPQDGKTRPDIADAMAVRHGHIYLSFTNSQFLTVLDARTGAYLQTVVGAPPGMLDVAPTQTPLPDSPDKLSDADFGVIALGDGVIGRILFAHDPFWVVTSDMAQLERDATFTALTVIGDHGKFHPRTTFIGYGAPYHQVKGYSLLNMDEPAWIAGRPGGRAPLGPWQADGLRAVRGVALAPDGKLWVVESDGFPKRISVWDTTGKQGKLVREFFGPAEKGDTGVAINPLDSDVMFAQGCEWRIDRKTGGAKCLGVVTRDPVGRAQYGIGKNGHAYLITQSQTHPVDIFERLSDGQFQLRSRIYYTDGKGNETTSEAVKTVTWADENGDSQIQQNELSEDASVIPFQSPAQDLSFITGGIDPDHGESRGWCKVTAWSASGAPRYDLKAIRATQSFTERISADGRLAFFRVSGTSCRSVDGDEPVHWTFPEAEFGSAIGSALLPPPVKNVWVLASQEKGWHILNEDGFVLGRFFESDETKAVWPKFAVPGADINHAVASLPGSVAQAINGRVFLAAGDSAYWNMEVTGFEKVKALPGGKLTVPVVK
jgi:hypothetical protein